VDNGPSGVVEGFTTEGEGESPFTGDFVGLWGCPVVGSGVAAFASVGGEVVGVYVGGRADGAILGASGCEVVGVYVGGSVEGAILGASVVGAADGGAVAGDSVGAFVYPFSITNSTTIEPL